MRLLTSFSALLLFSTASAAQTTYWQAPFTGTGAACVPRTDLGTLPSNNDDPVLVATRELINEGRPDNDQAYLDISNVMTQNYQCIPESAHRAGRAREPRCGSTQVSFTLPFRRKASANINLIFETTEMRFHGYANGAPLWIGTSDSGTAYAPWLSDLLSCMEYEPFDAAQYVNRVDVAVAEYSQTGNDYDNAH